MWETATGCVRVLSVTCPMSPTSSEGKNILGLGSHSVVPHARQWHLDLLGLGFSLLSSVTILVSGGVITAFRSLPLAALMNPTSFNGLTVRRQRFENPRIEGHRGLRVCHLDERKRWCLSSGSALVMAWTEFLLVSWEGCHHRHFCEDADHHGCHRSCRERQCHARSLSALAAWQSGGNSHSRAKRSAADKGVYDSHPVAALIHLLAGRKSGLRCSSPR